MRWIQATDTRLQVDGLPWFAENERRFLRLPMRGQTRVRPEIWDLAEMPSGGVVRFRSNTTAVTLRVAHAKPVQMWNMPASGYYGIDIYVNEGGGPRYWGSTRPTTTDLAYETEIFADITPAEREYILYLPTYSTLERLEIGLSDGATLLPPSPYALPKPVVFYGSSITQGGCATRPGNGYVPTLGRLLHVEVVNEGYSGNGLGEPEVAELLSEIDAACFVLDFHCNVTTVDGLQQVHAPFYRTLRAAHPDMPILILSMLALPLELHNKATLQKRLGQTAVLRATYEEAVRNGDRNVHFFDGAWLLTPDSAGAFVDGIHPTDLGFATMAERLAPVLHSILFER